MALCLLAGQGARASVADCCGAGESTDGCEQVHLTDDGAPREHPAGDDCPVEHDHGCYCAQGFALDAGQPAASRLDLPKNSRTGVRHEDEAPPEGPFLSGEKPPLI